MFVLNEIKETFIMLKELDYRLALDYLNLALQGVRYE